MLGCEICIHAEVMHNALMEWRTRRLCHFTETLAKLEKKMDTLEQAQFLPEVTLTAGEEEDLARLQDTYLEVFDGRQKYLETDFEDDEGLLQKQRTIKDVLDGMTCQPVGGSALGNDFHHYCTIAVWDAVRRMVVETLSHQQVRMTGLEEGLVP
jgi:hypothetical protein